MTVTKPEESLPAQAGKEKWSGLTGRIDEKLLKSLNTKYNILNTNPTWWVCGPPPMVDAMELALNKLQVLTGHIRSEKFTGY